MKKVSFIFQELIMVAKRKSKVGAQAPQVMAAELQCFLLPGGCKEGAEFS